MIINLLFISGLIAAVSAANYATCLGRRIGLKTITRLIRQNDLMSRKFTVDLSKYTNPLESVSAIEGSKNDISNAVITKNNFESSIKKSDSRKVWSNEEYEAALINLDRHAIWNAYQAGKLNFEYIPSVENFYNNLLDMGPEFDIIIMRYLYCGAFNRMRLLGLIDYKNIIESAVMRENYLIAGIVLKIQVHLIKEATAESEIYSMIPDIRIILKYGMEHLELLDITQLDTIPLYQYYMLQFFRKWNSQFKECPIVHWKLQRYEEYTEELKRRGQIKHK